MQTDFKTIVIIVESVNKNRILMELKLSSTFTRNIWALQFLVCYLLYYQWKFCRWKVTKCLASNENYNQRKIRQMKFKTDEKFSPMKILTNKYNFLWNHDIFVYFLLPRTSDVKMFSVALIKPKILDLGLES